MYLTGKGVQRDYSRASALFEQAAKNGDAWAANNLGGMYEMGWGVKQDWQKALVYYNQASKKGNEHAYQGFRRLSAALGPSVTAAVIASTAEESEAKKTGEGAEKAGVGPPQLKARAAPNTEDTPAPRSKKAKPTTSRTITKKQAPSALGQAPAPNNRSQNTSKQRGTCSESLLKGLFKGLGLCD